MRIDKPRHWIGTPLDEAEDEREALDLPSGATAWILIGLPIALGLILLAILHFR